MLVSGILEQLVNEIATNKRPEEWHYLTTLCEEQFFEDGRGKGFTAMANILVVDQYLSMGLLYREVLQDEGHCVFVALSGREALDLALHERVDMAIVDDTLPDFSAEELFEELKRLQYRLKGIVIVSTDFGPEHDARLWHGILFKTNNFTLLEAEVERLLNQSLGPS